MKYIFYLLLCACSLWIVIAILADANYPRILYPIWLTLVLIIVVLQDRKAKLKELKDLFKE